MSRKIEMLLRRHPVLIRGVALDANGRTLGFQRRVDVLGLRTAAADEVVWSQCLRPNVGARLPRVVVRVAGDFVEQDASRLNNARNLRYRFRHRRDEVEDVHHEHRRNGVVCHGQPRGIA